MGGTQDSANHAAASQQRVTSYQMLQWLSGGVKADPWNSASCQAAAEYPTELRIDIDFSQQNGGSGEAVVESTRQEPDVTKE
ncbi:hypothetical protein ACJZ2D_014921 [Fusarium nematophilum]